MEIKPCKCGRKVPKGQDMTLGSYGKNCALLGKGRGVKPWTSGLYYKRTKKGERRIRRDRAVGKGRGKRKNRKKRRSRRMRWRKRKRKRRKSRGGCDDDDDDDDDDDEDDEIPAFISGHNNFRKETDVV
ncbi:hypothetical protein PoB_000172900 [Plakobranchus ocellatus]|uniref:Uncharacterized protein n=1 Tax=Plakobranchus ocellatus TaxID=259542 RepID=A0AAV3XWH4_9GAST|nr:hypothetical protein PoB_000172900 [Plakobranchus ocellatus]